MLLRSILLEAGCSEDFDSGLEERECGMVDEGRLEHPWLKPVRAQQEASGHTAIVTI
jgi:hypothetical protein